MRFDALSFGCLWWSESLGLVLGRFFPFFVRPAEPPAQCRASVQVKRRYLRPRTVAFLSLFNFALPTPSSARRRGATRVSCCRVTWYRTMYRPVCHLSLFCVLRLFYFVFRPNISPPRGSVGAATFHSGYLSFLRLIPCHADGPRDVFRQNFSFVLASVFHSISTSTYILLLMRTRGRRPLFRLLCCRGKRTAGSFFCPWSFWLFLRASAG